MKILKLLCLILFVMVTMLNAQIVNVKGNISTSREVVKNALITFTDENDTTKIYSTLTDSLGSYSIGLITSMEETTPAIPSKFELAQNYPNPFTTSTAISYKLNNQSDVQITIYDILGREVKKFNIGEQQAGVHGILWDGKNSFGQKATTGIYFYRLQTGKESLVKKMVFVREAGSGTNLNLSSNFVPAAKLNKNSAAKITLESYTVKITNSDSTEPRIAAKEMVSIPVFGDTTLNFSVNKLPVANAGEDSKVNVGQYVILDGTKSVVGDGSILYYYWTADTTNPAKGNPTPCIDQWPIGFIKEGTYRISLVVNDGIADSEPDEVVIEVGPRGESRFEDPVMESYVRYTLKDPTGELTDEKFASIDTMITEGMLGEVTSLKGIENCSNLILLSISLNNFSDLTPLSGLTKLKTLSSSQNYIITDITPLANLTNLTKLNLESNNISDISALANLTKMYSLHLIGNPIEDISALKNMIDLNDLWLGRYGSNTYPFTGEDVILNFTKLTTLWINGCDVQDASFVSKLAVLHYLRLSHCNISDISAIENCTQLERLYLGDNTITDITALEGLTNLTILDLRDNQITDIESLVKNSGLGINTAISLIGNPLDSVSINQYIPELIERGVTVFY